MPLGKNRLIVVSGLIALAGAWLAWDHHRRSSPDRTPGSAWQKRNSADNRRLSDRISPTPAGVRLASSQVNPPNALMGSPGVPEASGSPPPSASVAGSTPPFSPAPPSVMAFELYYAGLFRRLNFTPDQVAQFKGLRDTAALDALNALPAGEREQIGSSPAAVRHLISMTESNLDAQVQAQFGEGLYAQYKLDQLTFSERITVDQLAQSLQASASPLTDEQGDQLVRIMAHAESPGSKLSYYQITPEIISQATVVLAPEQLQALQQLQFQQAQQLRSQEAAGN